MDELDCLRKLVFVEENLNKFIIDWSSHLVTCKHNQATQQFCLSEVFFNWTNYKKDKSWNLQK